MINEEQDEVSKSRRKRELNELKKLGTDLLDFSHDELRQLLLPEVLLDAIETAKRITSNNARKRQLQYIGKLMKGIDPLPVQEAVDRKKHQSSTKTRGFHQLESLRDTLLSEGDSALNKVLARYPHTDRQHLRKLVRQARQEQDTGQPSGAARLLFRYLRELQEEPDY